MITGKVFKGNAPKFGTIDIDISWVKSRIDEVRNSKTGRLAMLIDVVTTSSAKETISCDDSVNHGSWLNRLHWIDNPFSSRNSAKVEVKLVSIGSWCCLVRTHRTSCLLQCYFVKQSLHPFDEILCCIKSLLVHCRINKRIRVNFQNEESAHQLGW